MSLIDRLKANLSRKGEKRGRLHIREVANVADDLASAETLGAALRAARRRQAIDVETVAADLKIREKHIRALEDGDFEALPSLPYALGFVRSYADYLSMDAVQCLRRYKEEQPTRPDKKTFKFPEARDEVRLPQGSIFILAVLLGAGIYGGWYLSVKADRLVMSRVPPVPERLVEQTGSGNGFEAQSGSGEVEPVTSPKRSIGGPALQYSGSHAQSSTDAVVENADDARFPSTARSGEGPAVDMATDDVAAVNARVVLLAQSRAWIRVEDSESRVLIQRELQSGERYQVPNRPGLILSVRDAGAFEVIVDGQTVGLLGVAGQALPSVSLDPLSLKTKRAS